jgi:hypothetical protein
MSHCREPKVCSLYFIKHSPHLNLFQLKIIDIGANRICICMSYNIFTTTKFHENPSGIFQDGKYGSTNTTSPLWVHFMQFMQFGKTILTYNRRRGFGVMLLFHPGVMGKDKGLCEECVLKYGLSYVLILRRTQCLLSAFFL